MDDANTSPHPTATQCRIARLRLDGADDRFIVKRLDVVAESIEPAWEVCRKALSAKLQAADFANGVSLTDAQLHARASECLRCLLDWEEMEARKIVLDSASSDKSAPVEPPEDG
jgi:hypothetical protein